MSDGFFGGEILFGITNSAIDENCGGSTRDTDSAGVDFEFVSDGFFVGIGHSLIILKHNNKSAIVR